MCLLTYFPGGVMPDVDALQNGAIFNDDGHGYAIVDPVGNRIIIDHGMNAKEMIFTFETMRKRYPKGPALFHSRMATDGLVNLLNCHPFTIGGDNRTVLAHNGIYPIRPEKGDIRSDTRIVAESYIPRAYGTLRRRRARLAFERWQGSWNKTVILTVDPRFRDHAFILNEDYGIWDDTGIWYSNDMFRGFGTGRYTYIWADEGLTPVVLGKSGGRHECPGCGTRTDFMLYGECQLCGYCFDCGQMPDECQCYVPTRRLDDLRSMG